mmetsp:Transcript_91462/g.217970  ORF Transcript_91462/g.217970 Transcript_91462/m.217970 type:complete len:314 (+) Transcript_91462:132-1073(+)
MHNARNRMQVPRRPANPRARLASKHVDSALRPHELGWRRSFLFFYIDVVLLCLVLRLLSLPSRVHLHGDEALELVPQLPPLRQRPAEDLPAVDAVDAILQAHDGGARVRHQQLPLPRVPSQTPLFEEVAVVPDARVGVGGEVPPPNPLQGLLRAVGALAGRRAGGVELAGELALAVGPHEAEPKRVSLLDVRAEALGQRDPDPQIGLRGAGDLGVQPLSHRLILVQQVAPSCWIPGLHAVEEGPNARRPHCDVAWHGEDKPGCQLWDVVQHRLHGEDVPGRAHRPLVALQGRLRASSPPGMPILVLRLHEGCR